MEEHEKALTLLAHKLKDYKQAKEYCHLYSQVSLHPHFLQCSSCPHFLYALTSSLPSTSLTSSLPLTSLTSSSPSRPLTPLPLHRIAVDNTDRTFTRLCYGYTFSPETKSTPPLSALPSPCSTPMVGTLTEHRSDRPQLHTVIVHGFKDYSCP